MIENILEGNLLVSFFLGTLVAALATATGCVALTALRKIVYYFHYGRCIDKNSLLPELRCRPIWCLFILYRLVFWQKMKNIPPLCSILQFIRGFGNLFDKKGIYRFWILNRPLVFFLKPKTVEVILRSTEIIEKGSEYRFLHPWLGTGILTSTGDKWRSRRKLMTPFFHFRVLQDFLPVFDEQSRVLVEKLKKLTEKPWVDVVPLMTMCTLDIICQTAMEVKINAQNEGSSEYVKAICNIGEITVYRILRPWLWIDSIFFCCQVGRKYKASVKLINDFSKKVIREKKCTVLERISKSPKVISDITSCSPSFQRSKQVLLELLVEHHLKDISFTEQDIQHEINTIIFGGHDTTAMTISWTLYNLGLHPDIQDDVQNELDRIFEGDSSEAITLENLREMKYLEYTIKESLRLYPPVPIFIREIRKDTSVDKFTVPAGSAAVINALVLHKNSEVFPNPEKFDPERFFPENCNGRHPYAYLPFSAGPRNCIGQKYAILEVKTVLSHVLRNFRVKSLDTRDKINLELAIVMRNVEPLRIRFTPRT